VEIACTPINIGDKAATLVQTIDVNDRVLTDKENKDLSKKLCYHKERLDDILSSVNEVIWAIRVDTKDFIYINDFYYKVLGYTPKAVIADKSLFLDKIHPDDIC